MSLYLIVLIMLLGFSIYEYKKKKTQRVLYWIAFGVLTAMLVLRYGQGTDYFSYYYNFLSTPPIWQFSELLATNVHGEAGWLFINAVFRGFGIPFHVLVVLVALLTMYSLHRFLSRHSTMMTVSLLLAYPTIFLTYAMSAIRQGLVLAIFLGFLIDWLYEKKYVRYILVTLACALIHSSALVFLALFAVKFITIRLKPALLLMAVCAVVGFLSSKLLVSVFDSLVFYANDGFYLLAVGERVISAGVIIFVFRDVLSSKETAHSSKLMYLLQIYLYSCFIYCFLAWSARLGSRFAIFFKAVELVLFVHALLSEPTVTLPGRIASRLRLGTLKPIRVQKVIACYLLGLTLLMYFKNIGSYIGQNQYIDGINIFNYPYFSILNKDYLEEFMTIPFDLSRFFG